MGVTHQHSVFKCHLRRLTMKVLPLLLCLVAAAAVCRADDDDDDDFELDDDNWYLVVIFFPAWNAVRNGPCVAYGQVPDYNQRCCNYYWWGYMEKDQVSNKCHQPASTCKLGGDPCDRDKRDFCCWDLGLRCDQTTKTCKQDRVHCVRYGYQSFGHKCCNYKIWGKMKAKNGVCYQDGCEGRAGHYCDRNQGKFCCWDQRLKCNQATKRCQ